MNKFFKIILCLLLTLMLSACYIEPDAKFTVTAIGFSGKENGVEAYLQTIDFANTKNGNTATFLTSGSGKTVNKALQDIKTKLSKAPSFEHCQIVLVSNGIEGEVFNQTLTLCETLGMSQRVTIAYANNIPSALENNKITSGTELMSLIKQNAKTLGFGKHNALFEIKTAILENGGNFALVNIQTKNEEIKFSGLYEYKNSQQFKALNLKQSLNYQGDKAK
ncbi:MAG: hypothetical protein IIX54_06665 [Clostridia bacterium]|nr:hypothetical protein [Clostridia bacterium]